MSQQPYSQQPYPAPQAAPAGYQQNFSNGKGFFGSLYDFGFTSFVTTRVVGALYIVIVALSTVCGLISLIVTLTRSSYEMPGIAKLFSVLLIVIGIPLFHLLMRVTLEFYVAGIRTAENTSTLVAIARGGAQQMYQSQAPVQPRGLIRRRCLQCLLLQRDMARCLAHPVQITMLLPRLMVALRGATLRGVDTQQRLVQVLFRKPVRRRRPSRLIRTRPKARAPELGWWTALDATVK